MHRLSHAVKPSVYEVPHEEIVGVRAITTYLRQSDTATCVGYTTPLSSPPLVLRITSRVLGEEAKPFEEPGDIRYEASNMVVYFTKKKHTGLSNYGTTASLFKDFSGERNHPISVRKKNIRKNRNSSWVSTTNVWRNPWLSGEAVLQQNSGGWMKASLTWLKRGHHISNKGYIDNQIIWP